MPDQQEMDDLQTGITQWEEDTLQSSLDRFPERRSQFITTSSELINRLILPSILRARSMRNLLATLVNFHSRAVSTRPCIDPGSGPCVCSQDLELLRKPIRDSNTC